MIINPVDQKSVKFTAKSVIKIRFIHFLTSPPPHDAKSRRLFNIVKADSFYRDSGDLF